MGTNMNWGKRNQKSRAQRWDDQPIVPKRKHYPERGEIPPRKPLTDSRGRPITLPKLKFMEDVE